MIKIADENRCCKNCQFYYEEGRECRRFPPQVWGDPSSETTCSYACNYPEVTESCWCGEFKPHEVWVLPTGFKIINADGTEFIKWNRT